MSPCPQRRVLHKFKLSALMYMCFSFDFTASYIDLRYVYDNVEKWAAPQKAETTLSFYPMKPQTKAEPKGTVLIIAPFNFPVFLTMGPLAGFYDAGIGS